MLSSKASDVAASNQLAISINIISNGQKWARQVRGAYSILYPWMIGDFVHLKDFNMWLKQYSQHIHGNGNNGSPTTKPLAPATFSTVKAYSYIVPVEGIGKIRKGFSEAIQTITEISAFQSRS